MGHKYVKEEDTFSTSANGTVPKPTAQEVADNKFLRADGTWKVGGGGGSEVEVDQVVTNGIEIGGVSVDGLRTALYAPFQTYSTAERRVGTWIDGKPLYEKTFSATISGNGNVEIGSIAGLNVETYFIVASFAQTSSASISNGYRNADSSAYYSTYVRTSDNTIRAVVLAYSGATATTVLRYTKSTDTV